MTDSSFRQVKSVNGIFFEIDSRQAIDREISEHGYFEPSTAQALRRLCLPGFVVFDIGANIGAHTFHLANYVGPTGTVIAFEPTTYAFMRLCRNMLLNPFTNIRLERIALSDTNGVTDLAFTSSWSSDGVHQAPTMEPMVHMTTDEYVRRNRIPRVDLIKLDVDGYEVKIVRGTRSVIESFRPIIVMELCHYTLEHRGDTVLELLDFLYSRGYRFHSESTYQLLGDPASIAQSVPPDASINVLAIHPM